MIIKPKRNFRYELTKRIRNEIERKNLSKEDFAELMEEDLNKVEIWLKGNYDFDIETIVKIECRLGIKLIKIKL